jgi:hypothetical protein
MIAMLILGEPSGQLVFYFYGGFSQRYRLKWLIGYRLIG